MVLSDLITENLVLLGVAADTKEEALKQTSETLYSQGYVKDTFYDALLDREAQYPTGLSIPACDIAIPHVTPDQVNRSGIAVAVLNKAVGFCRVDDPGEQAQVRIIFNIALDQNGKQVEVLQKLMGFISDESILKKMLQAKTKKEIIELVGKVE